VISSQAKNSFERIFERAARTRLILDEGHSCEIRQIDAGEWNAAADGVKAAQHAKAINGQRVAVLTISSIAFRLLLGLHFNEEDAALRRYFVKEGDERPFAEAFMEIANLCCGAMNQALVEHFPDLGMSTPYVLASDCMSHLAELHPDYEALFDVTIDGCVRLFATICVCAHGPVDFVADTSESEAHASGELELF
jgi:hypothetical protein